MGRIYHFLFLAIMAVALRAESGWQTNFEAAKKQAKESKKAVLLDFTGSDWCGYCIKLKKSVFTKPEFEKFAEKNLVLVELDFPNNKKLPKEVAEQNEALRKQFKIEGYPTIVLLNGEGKEIERLEGYDGETASSYVKKLETILAKK